MATELEDLKILQVVEEVVDNLWEEVSRWDEFSRSVIGMQMARSADSIGANIAEAYGRFHYGEKIQFMYYARGSLFETKYWINRSAARKLLTEQQSRNYARQLSEIARQLNKFVKSLKQQKLNTHILRESPIDYHIADETVLFTLTDFEWLANFTRGSESPTTSLQSPASTKESTHD